MRLYPKRLRNIDDLEKEKQLLIKKSKRLEKEGFEVTYRHHEAIYQVTLRKAAPGEASIRSASRCRSISPPD